MKFLIKIAKCKKNEQSSDKNAAIIGRKMYICHPKYYSSIEICQGNQHITVLR